MAGMSVMPLGLVGILVGIGLLLGFLSLGLFDLGLGFRGLSLLDRGVFGLDLFDRLFGRRRLGRGLVGNRRLLGQGLVGNRRLLGQGLVGNRRLLGQGLVGNRRLLGQGLVGNRRRGLRRRSLLRGGGATSPVGLRRH